jgi:hypothetical protein
MKLSAVLSTMTAIVLVFPRIRVRDGSEDVLVHELRAYVDEWPSIPALVAVTCIPSYHSPGPLPEGWPRPLEGVPRNSLSTENPSHQM